MNSILPFLVVALAATASGLSNGNANDIISVLGPQLSPKASIVFPNDTEWTNVTARWSSYNLPNLQVDVEAYEVGDIQATVKYAAARKIPLLVKNTGHGWTTTIRDNVKHGIQLRLRNMNTIEVDAKNNVATIGPGVNNYEIIEALYAVNKRTATGTCDCVGVIGAAMGGGVGHLQGVYGLVLDNLVSADVVLADGKLVTVSAQENSDLYWAMRGAGHNFGVVASAKVRAHDPKDDIWSITSYAFAGEKLAKVFGYLNDIRSTQPELLTILTYIVANPDDLSKPLIEVGVQYGGTPESYSSIVQPILDIGPVTASNTTRAKWNKLADATNCGIDQPRCAEGTGVRANEATTMLMSLDIEVMQEIYDYHANMLVKYPQFRNSTVYFESYPLQEVKAVPEDSTAYPHREFNAVGAIEVSYANASQDTLATELALKARAILQKSSGVEQLNVYVNYGHGDEGDRAWYGDESWRQQRLKALKKKYDSQGVFNAYNPILV